LQFRAKDGRFDIRFFENLDDIPSCNFETALIIAHFVERRNIDVISSRHAQIFVIYPEQNFHGVAEAITEAASEVIILVPFVTQPALQRNFLRTGRGLIEKLGREYPFW